MPTRPTWPTAAAAALLLACTSCSGDEPVKPVADGPAPSAPAAKEQAVQPPRPAAPPAALRNGKATTIVSSTQPAGTIHPSLANEVHAAINRSLDWLAANQKEDGSWSNGMFPALTAMPLESFLRSEHPDKAAVVKKAVDYLRGCVRADGGIYREAEGRRGGGLSNYNTAVCMTALHATGDPALIPIVQEARRFLAGSQRLGDETQNGGFSYHHTDREPNADLLNTLHAVHAMTVTASVEDRRPKGQKRVDIDWDRAAAFIGRMQNQADAGEAEAGGFVYNRTDPKAGTMTNEAGTVVFKAYGSITYVGLLSMIYAKLPKDDPRVLSALDWSARHWTLAENPGQGNQGLFFFYNVLTLALSASGRDLIPRPNETFINWREDMAKKLVSTQTIDAKTGHGYWLNANGRFWERDPVLVTSYCLEALQAL